MNDALRQARTDLAAAFRWAARLGYHESVSNHFTYAANDEGTRFLVNPWGPALLRDEGRRSPRRRRQRRGP